MSPLERTLVEAIARGSALRVRPAPLPARVAAAAKVLPACPELLPPDELCARVRAARRILRDEPSAPTAPPF